MTAVIVAGLISCGLTASLIDTPGRVDIEIDNPTVYDIRIEARAQPGDGWMTIATIERESTRKIEQVFDLGDDTWTFRFTAQARDAGTAEWTRHELEAARWHIQIPAEVAQSLRDQAAQPSPLF